METHCGICQHAIEATQPTTQLLCEHRFHTECILRRYAAYYIGDMRCFTCNGLIRPRDMLEEQVDRENEATSNSIIQYMWENEPEFKNEIIKMKTACNDLTKSYTTSSKKQKEMIQKFKQDNNAIIQHMYNSIVNLKKEILAIREVKDCRTKGTVFKRARTQFTAKWGISLYKVNRGLDTIPQARKYRFRYLRMGRSVKTTWGFIRLIFRGR